MTKINYSQKQLVAVLKTACIFCGIGLIFILLSLAISTFPLFSLESIGAGLLAIGLLKGLQYAFMRQRQYLLIKDGKIIRNGLIRKEVKITELYSFRYLAGTYLLMGKEKVLKVDSRLMDKRSRNKWQEILKKLNIHQH